MKTNNPTTKIAAEDSDDILEAVIDQVIHLESDLVSPWHPILNPNYQTIPKSGGDL